MVKRFLVLVVAGMLLLGFAGCKKEGAAEKAGKKLDQAMDSAKKSLDDLKK